MWVIRRIGFTTVDGEIDFVPYYIASEYGLNSFYTSIWLENTKTGEEIIVDNGQDGSDLVDIVKKYSPYGYVPMHENARDMKIGHSIVCVDDLSLQFLEYVDSVSSQFSPETPALRAFTSSLKGSFYHIDVNRTLFKCNIASTCLCTLFEAMLFCPDGWFGDEFFLYTRRVVGWSFRQSDLVYRVKFNNVKKAKRLITKALVSGMNPISERLNVSI